jgi:hypothetical protein
MSLRASPELASRSAASVRAFRTPIYHGNIETGHSFFKSL